MLRREGWLAGEGVVTAGTAIAIPGPGVTVDVLGVPVSTLSLSESADLVVRWAREGGARRYACATSVHGIIEAQLDPAFRRILNGAALVMPDGMPLVWLGRLEGARRMERVYGPDLTLEVCRRAAAVGGVRHFFYGGAAGVPEQLAERLRDRFPGLEVAGALSPPFRELSDQELAVSADQINAHSPHIVWVGLSTPKQERLIGRMRERVEAPIMVSVGAAFDFHTGRVPQAPKWMQRAGLEWLFRLAKEPRRLWRRYLRNNPLFALLAIAQLTGMRRPHGVEPQGSRR